MNKCKLVWVTPDAEKIMGYCARVSNPANQDNPDVSKLLSYCIKNKHWSVFEMANMCVEVNTSIPISAQILRHNSMKFQQFSARYSKVQGFEEVEVRRQDEKNRQNSIDDLSEETKIWFHITLNKIKEETNNFYNEALERGVAKECARFALPQCASTRMYINGSIRSWIHYLELRTGNGTQKEHQDIAKEIKNIFIELFPQVSKGLRWIE
jgi:thymidylate synthase (FAD)